MSDAWLKTLMNLVEQKPLVILRFTEEEWGELLESRRGLRQFTVARRNALVKDIHTPTACLFYRGDETDPEARFGLLSGRGKSTTLETWLKVKSAHDIAPSTEEGLLDLVTLPALATSLAKKLASSKSVIRLSAKLSAHLIEHLAARPANAAAMRSAIASLDAPKAYRGNDGLQQDAVDTALKVFGLSPGDEAILRESAIDSETALARVSIREDAAVARDASSVPGFNPALPDLTGRAVFEKQGERLEIITANRGSLEEVFGVDLIYFNAAKKNIVMLQYKMLERERADDDTDWIYRPNEKLDDQIERMRKFTHPPAPSMREYRFNPQVFYLRFVQRDATLGKRSITMPLDHFDLLRDDPASLGPRGGFRISYQALAGRWLHQEPFLDLVRSGYVGSYAATTNALSDLIDAALSDGRAVVAAVQSAVAAPPGARQRRR